MGEMITLKSKDGFEFGAYHATPTDARRGGIVLIQEIFGVTGHVKALVDDYAADGYEVIAPSYYDRLERGFAVPDYSPESVARGVAHSRTTPWDEVAADTQAAVDALKDKGPVFVTGHCWGGSASWLAAARVDGIAAVSSFYGTRIATELLGETPKVPTILHFGKKDASIPPENIAKIAEKNPDVPIYVYNAEHGFVSDRPTNHDVDATRLSHLRTLQLFTKGSGRGES